MQNEKDYEAIDIEERITEMLCGGDIFKKSIAGILIKGRGINCLTNMEDARKIGIIIISHFLSTARQRPFTTPSIHLSFCF